MAKTININEYLIAYYKTMPELDEVKIELNSALKKYFPDYNINAIKNLDYDRSLVEFENWLVQTVTQDPLPISAKSLYFNIIDNSTKDDLNGPHAPEIQICITASKYLPSEKPNDWFLNKLWEPTSKNSEIKAFKTMSNSIKNYVGEGNDLQHLLFGLMASTLLVNGFDIIKHEFLVYQNSIKIGFGFNYENGPKYVLGTLTEDGITLD